MFGINLLVDYGSKIWMYANNISPVIMDAYCTEYASVVVKASFIVSGFLTIILNYVVDKLQNNN